jgi:hypothetical protein
LAHRQPGRDIALSEAKDGKFTRTAPPSTITLSGNGLDTAHIEDEEDSPDAAGNGVNLNPPRGI